jgi:hypothetical protein
MLQLQGYDDTNDDKQDLSKGIPEVTPGFSLVGRLSTHSSKYV